MMIVKSKGQQLAYLIGRKDALRTTSEYVEQLLDELHAARVELQTVRAERAAMMAKAQARFDADAAEMRRELQEAIAELHQLRLSMFQKWTRHEGDRLQ
jgi:peptidoglycan hydrolase CwlO-like protein